MNIDPRAYSEKKLTPPGPLPFISRRALARVKNPVPAPTDCRYCGASVRLVNNSEIYGREFGDWPFAYFCSGCRAYVGLHPKTDIPLGTLADDELRKARNQCKKVFHAVMERSGLSRTRAYQWLADQMEIEVDHCHWGWFEVDQCKRAAAICAAEYNKLSRRSLA